MINNNLYLKGVIDKYTRAISVFQPSKLNELETELKKWAGDCYVDVKRSGSYSKGTSISLTSDIDLLVSLRSGCNEHNGGLEGIYNALFAYLNSRYMNVRRQNVSVGLELPGPTILAGNYKIDVTPGRLQPNSNVDHSLYISKTRSWTKTNIHKHIEDIKNSGFTNEIRLLKTWRELNGLEFTSIYLEYLVLNILSGRNKGLHCLAENFWHILVKLSNGPENPLYLRVIDPANSSNILSDTLTDAEKQKIINAALLATRQNNWNNIVG